MKAIVLTYDKNRVITEHMIKKYALVWPDHPFIFRIPYQELIGENDNFHEFINSSKDIKQTVFTLLQDLDDEEWVYWCIDDKYPIELATESLEKIYRDIISDDDIQYDALLFCHRNKYYKRSVRLDDYFTDSNGIKIFKRKSYPDMWIHQFIKVKVLKHVFNAFPDVIPYAKIMDDYLAKITPPAGHRLYITGENFAFFGESTWGGVITANAYLSLKKHKFLTTNFKIDKSNFHFIGLPFSLKMKIMYHLVKYKKDVFKSFRSRRSIIINKFSKIKKTG